MNRCVAPMPSVCVFINLEYQFNSCVLFLLFGTLCIELGQIQKHDVDNDDDDDDDDDDVLWIARRLRKDQSHLHKKGIGCRGDVNNHR